MLNVGSIRVNTQYKENSMAHKSITISMIIFEYVSQGSMLLSISVLGGVGCTQKVGIVLLPLRAELFILAIQQNFQ